MNNAMNSSLQLASQILSYMMMLLKTSNLLSAGFFLNNFIYLFIWLRWKFVAVLAFSPVVASWGNSLVAVYRLLTAVASLSGSTGSRASGLQLSFSKPNDHQEAMRQSFPPQTYASEKDFLSARSIKFLKVLVAQSCPTLQPHEL